MKTETINLARLRNEEHCQFHTEMAGLVAAHGAAALGLEAQAASHAVFLADEKEALDVVRKSATTEELTDADGARDEVFRGLADVVRANLRHYERAVRDAAARLAVIFDGYGNVVPKPYDEETAAISSLLDELQGRRAEDLAALGLSGWAAELNNRNELFIELKKSRYTEDAGRTQLKMKEVRAKIDDAYRGMVRRLEALAVVNGETPHSQAFSNELNARMAKFGMTLSQRAGRSAEAAKDASK